MKRNTKSALLLSVVSIIVCCTMLLGTTMAWFTDSVTSASNIIKAGNLDVKMYYLDGEEYLDVEAEGTSPIFDYDLWEPGYTEYRIVKIENAGSLAFKYKLNVIPTGEVGILADVIDVYYADGEVELTRDTLGTDAKLVGTLSDVIGGTVVADGTLYPEGNADNEPNEVYVTIALKMQESAGNEYQGKSVGDAFDIQLLATQLTYEKDSFDDQYDKHAPATVVSTVEDLTEALANGEDVFAESGEYIQETEDPITLDAKGATVTLNGEGPSTGVYGFLGFISDEVTLSNLNVTGTGFVEVGDYYNGGGTYIVNNLVIENLASTLKNGDKGHYLACGFVNYGNATLNNCVMTGTTAIRDGAIAVDVGCVNNTVTTINGGEYGTIYCWSNSTVTINGAEVDCIYASPIRGSLTIAAGTHVGMINVDYGTSAQYATDENLAKLAIEEGATVDEIIFNGTTYSLAEWLAR